MFTESNQEICTSQNFRTRIYIVPPTVNEPDMLHPPEARSNAAKARANELDMLHLPEASSNAVKARANE